MRELFAKWVSSKVPDDTQEGVTGVTGVTELKTLKIECNTDKNQGVTGVTDANESPSTPVTPVTPPKKEVLQPNLNITSRVTPVTLVTPDFIDSLSEAELEAWEERAAILEFDGEMSRSDAEAEAMRLLQLKRSTDAGEPDKSTKEV